MIEKATESQTPECIVDNSELTSNGNQDLTTTELPLEVQVAELKAELARRDAEIRELRRGRHCQDFQQSVTSVASDGGMSSEHR